MRSIFALLIMVMSVGMANAQTESYHFISSQQEQVKYDSLNKAYFVDGEFKRTSGISIENNTISIVTPDDISSSIHINSANLESLANKESFTIEGLDIQSGEKVKLGFWFIAGVLEEVSYNLESTAYSISYKNISDSNETDRKAIVYTKPGKR